MDPLLMFVITSDKLMDQLLMVKVTLTRDQQVGKSLFNKPESQPNRGCLNNVDIWIYGNPPKSKLSFLYFGEG